MNGLIPIVLETSVRATLVAGSVGLILLLARVRAGALRHAAWTAVLAAMILMPVMPHLVPRVAVPIGIPVTLDETLPAAMDFPAGTEIPRETRAIPIPAPAAANPAIASSIWPAVGFGLYCTITLLLLTRLALGWRAARQVALAAEPVTAEGLGPRVYESDVVAVPLTFGVIAPRILLPSTWRAWPAAKLRAVLAHEAAHVKRRDSFVSLIAHINRCLFWFHPLAWWLERRLAVTAEQACDDAGVRAVGNSREYVETLLDMVESVRRNGARFSWQGVGMDGSGALGQRIDRILRGDLLRGTSRSRKILVATSGAIAIFLVAACQPKAQPSAEALAKAEASDREIRESITRNRAEGELQKAASEMTREQVAALEAAVQKNPEDLDARKKLLIFYSMSGEKVLGAKETIAARRPHILWLIEHHPENKLAGEWGARIFPTALDALPDPAGYAQAKKLWLAQADRDGQPIAIYSNAAEFFYTADKPLAERMLLRARAADPKSVGPGRLGRLYYHVLMGSNASMPQGVVRSISVMEAQSEYAAQIRKKLDESKDPQLLLSVGQMLIQQERTRMDVGFDQVALGKKYVEQALRLDPELAGAHRLLQWIRDRDDRSKLAHTGNGSLESRYQSISQLPEAERLRPLADLAESAYIQGDMADYYKKDLAAAKVFWEQSRKYGEEALQLASKFRDSPDYNRGFFRANMALGMVTMRGGDKRKAVKYLLEAAKAPSSKDLQYGFEHFPQKLAAALLKAGERDAVAEFLERYSQMNTANQDRWYSAAVLIRAGKLPFWAELENTPRQEAAQPVPERKRQ